MKVIKRITAIFALLFLCFSLVLQSVVVRVEAASPVVDYDKTDIMTDLADIDVVLYPKNPIGNVQVIRVQEYCYSDNAFYKDYYGLYLYVYNPTEKEISADGNVANMAISYNADGTVKSYKNTALTLLDKTEDKYDNRFFKFKVTDSGAIREIAESYAKAHGGERRYDIAGIQLNYGKGSAMDTTHAKTYYFKGFSKGMSATSTSENSLTARSEGLETIKLEVEHTNFRDDSRAIQSELNTVYFSVPDEYLTKYGGLQKIKAEWYEYVTSPVFVTDDGEAYAALESYIGKDIGGDRYDDLPWRVLWEGFSRSQLLPGANIPVNVHYFYKGYNAFTDGEGRYLTYNWEDAECITRFDWLFQRSDTSDKDSWSVSSEEVISYMKEYTKNHPEQKTFGIKNKYAENLFADSIDEDRIQYLENPADKRGYMCQEIEADDKRDLIIYYENDKWWQFWDRGDYVKESVKPIEVLDDSIKGMSAEAFGAKYYVNAEDAERVKDDCVRMLNAGEHPVLFRFAETDYYSSEAYFDKDGDVSGPTNNGYVAQETVFLDFDIISLTFRNEGGIETVIPVVSDPTDIINGLEAPSGIATSTDYSSLLKKVAAVVIGAIAIVILIFLIISFLPMIISGVIWIVGIVSKCIGAVFRGIGGVFRSSRATRKRRKAARELKNATAQETDGTAR